jgi:hypothetical protein
METEWGHFGGSVEHSEGKGGESAVTILRFLCGIPCLCRLRTEGLVPVSKYWTYRSHAGDMVPVNLVAYHQQVFDFLHCFIGWLRRETGYGLVDRSAGMLWIVSGALFLGSSDSAQLCRWLMKGCHVWGPPAGSVHRMYTHWHGKHMCHVGRVFPYRVYIDSKRCDSRIWVTACLWLPSSSNLLN